MEETKDILLQALTLEQWKTWVFIIVITSAITETAKRVFFITMTKVKKKRFIYATAFTVGCIAAVCGYMMVGVKFTPNYYWMMFGVTAGPAANLLHYIFLSLIAWKFPKLAEILKGSKNA